MLRVLVTTLNSWGDLGPAYKILVFNQRERFKKTKLALYFYRTNITIPPHIQLNAISSFHTLQIMLYQALFTSSSLILLLSCEQEISGIICLSLWLKIKHSRWPDLQNPKHRNLPWYLTRWMTRWTLIQSLYKPDFEVAHSKYDFSDMQPMIFINIFII